MTAQGTQIEESFPVFEDIKGKVVAYYDNCLVREGDSARGVDWKSRDAQQLAFRVIKSMGIREKHSVLDVGCGLAHFYDFLVAEGFSGAYAGVDISPKIIGAAKERLPHVPLLVADILKEPSGQLDRQYDFVVGSGILTTKVDTPSTEFETFIEALIKRMFELSRIGVIFNMLTSHVDYEVERLYYADPARYFSFARTLTRFISLKHDAPFYLFTMALYKDGDDYLS